MVTQASSRSPVGALRRSRGGVTVELVVAIAILAVGVIPVSYSVLMESRLLQQSYLQAIAMEMVDGEAEILAAGGWKEIATGEQTWTPRGEAAKNLPPGKFRLVRTDSKLRVRWEPRPGSHLKSHEREILLP